jgi:hypothetical protein
VVQTLATDRAHQSFHKWILPRGSRCRKHFLHSHISGHGGEVSSVDGISIAQHKSWRLTDKVGLTAVARCTITARGHTANTAHSHAIHPLTILAALAGSALIALSIFLGYGFANRLARVLDSG